MTQEQAEAVAAAIFNGSAWEGREARGGGERWAVAVIAPEEGSVAGFLHDRAEFERWWGEWGRVPLVRSPFAA